MAHEWTDADPELPRPSWYWISERLFGGGEHASVALISAGVTFFALLACSGACLTAVVAQAAFEGPSALPHALVDLGALTSSSTLTHGLEQLGAAAAQLPPTRLQLALAAGAGLTLLFAAAAGASLNKGLYTAYGLRDRRSWLGGAAAGLVSCLALLLGCASAWLVGAGAAHVSLSQGIGPRALDSAGVQWAVALAAVGVATMLHFHVGLRARPPGRSVAWGAGLALLGWLGSHALGSLAFDALAGLAPGWSWSLGVTTMLLSIYLGAFVVQLGAEVDACIAGDTRLAASGVVRPLDAPSRHFS